LGVRGQATARANSPNHQITQSSIEASMSARNGDKSRHQINRKRAVVRRAKIRQMLADRKATGDAAGARAPKTSR
jgi:hypothetical protein